MSIMSDILLSPPKKFQPNKALIARVDYSRSVNNRYSFYIFRFKKITVGRLFSYLNAKVIFARGPDNTYTNHLWFNNSHTNIESHTDFFYQRESYGHACLGSWHQILKATDVKYLHFTIKEYLENVNHLGYWRTEDHKSFNKCETCGRLMSNRYMILRKGKFYCCYDKYFYKKRSVSISGIPENVDISNFKMSNVRKAHVICTKK